MSEPPKKKLRQCSLQESFQKIPSFEGRKTRSKTRAAETNTCAESGMFLHVTLLFLLLVGPAEV